MVFQVCFCYLGSAFLPTTLASLLPGVMLLNHSIAPRGSTTSIEKTSQKGAPRQERPNRSLVIKYDAMNDTVEHTCHWLFHVYTDVT